MAADKIDLMVYFIQHGDTSLMAELWEDIRGLVFYYAGRYLISGNRFGIEKDDLVQCGYFALVDAVRLYDPEQGASFATYLSYHLLHQFQEATGRTDHKRGDILNHAASLDEPFNSDDPDGFSLIDAIADEHDYYAEADERIFTKQLHDALELALSEIPDQEAGTIRAEYWNGMTPGEIAEKRSLPVQTIITEKQRALRNIRHGKRTKELEQFLDSYTPFYKNIGLGWYQRTGMSSVEHSVFIRDRKEREYAGNICEAE